MKQSIGSLWLFSIMIVFILIFACYLIVTVEYNKVYKMKNQILTIIENNNGLTNVSGKKNQKSDLGSGTITTGSGALQTINAYLLGSGYQTTGKCPSGSDYTKRGEYWYGVDKLEAYSNVSYKKSNSGNQKFYYCFCKIKSIPKSSPNKPVYYYKVRLFFMFNFPVIQYLGIFDVDGTTNVIYNVADVIPEKY